MNSVYALLLVIVTGQGTIENHIGPAFIKYYDSFIMDANTHGYPLDPNTGITIQYGPMTMDSSAAECTHLGHMAIGATINVREDFWDKQPDRVRKSIIYHELGHCLLGREHSPYRTSFMYECAPAIDWVTYKAYPELFTQEMFDNAE